MVDSLFHVESSLGSSVFRNETAPFGSDSELSDDGIFGSHYSSVLSKQPNLGLSLASILGMAHVCDCS